MKRRDFHRAVFGGLAATGLGCGGTPGSGPGAAESSGGTDGGTTGVAGTGTHPGTDTGNADGSETGAPPDADVPGDVGTPEPDPVADIDADALDLAGPMVGHTTDLQSDLWVHGNEGLEGILVVRFWPESDPGAIELAPLPIVAADRGSGKARLDGLSPGTPYAFEILARDDVVVEAGSLTTAPQPGQPGQFRVAFTSCMHAGRYQEHQPAWAELMAMGPDLHVMMGDNVYANEAPADDRYLHHLRQRRIPEMAELIRAVPTWAIWDDHDYGPNDSDGTWVDKVASLEVFRQVFANPSFGTRDTPGVFHRFEWGDLEFFMMDGRFHRVSNSDKLGAQQTQWLVDALRTSTATFKVLVQGDLWSNNDAVAAAIVEHGLEGVIYASGDIHRANTFTRGNDGTYGSPELISSGIAVNTETPYHYFAVVDFDTTLADPTLTIRLFQLGRGDEGGPERPPAPDAGVLTEMTTQVWQLSSLRP